MTDLNTMRTLRNTWGRLILSVFVVSWLSVQLQPCAMAMEADAATAAQVSHSSHVMHDGDMTSHGSDAGDSHCPPSACCLAGSCDVEMSSVCAPNVQFVPDGHRVKPALKDVPQDLPLSVAPAINLRSDTNHERTPLGVSINSSLPGYRPPINLLNCIYLI